MKKQFEDLELNIVVFERTDIMYTAAGNGFSDSRYLPVNCPPPIA